MAKPEEFPANESEARVARTSLTFAERLARTDDTRDHVTWLKEQGLHDEVVSAITDGTSAYTIFKLLRSDYAYPYQYATIKALYVDHAPPAVVSEEVTP